MYRRNIQIKQYTLLFWLHYVASLVLLTVFSIVFYFCYFTDFQEKVTLAHLILMVLLIMLTTFFRINACHYQRFLWKEEEAARVRMSKEKLQQLREDTQFYE
ncbi:hypothetical protein LI951_10720 [Enterococcus sp. BWT-B8]|uniref:hypothetical protein n=1 Tax=Enterococcus sp. BWT-B8 TaxID=2885157 RepID=UPI001E562578|nr:hypothetical protein [Enterococcus sp. BWT-B8]MCB5952539.1 hypothetical protein [Enterococcus sp. BWT-B8]